MNDFKNQSPWGSPPGGGNGGFRRGPTPPDIEEIVKKIQNTINRFTGGGSGSSNPIILGLILCVVFLLSSVKKTRKTLRLGFLSASMTACLPTIKKATLGVESNKKIISIGQESLHYLKD